MPDLAAGAGISLRKDSALDLVRISTDVLSGRLAYATWAELAAAGGDEGRVAEVPLSDAGTHVDPVVGGTVDNSGVFRYSESPAGWERIADVDAVSAGAFADAAAASADSAALSASVGADLLWLAKIPNATTGANIIPALQVDFINKRAWLNGAVVSFASVTTLNSDGSYSLSVPTGLGSGVTYAVDYSFPDHFTTANKPTGNFFSALGDSFTARCEMAVTEVSPSTTVAPGGAQTVSTYLSAISANVSNFVSRTGTGAVARMHGVRREIISIPGTVGQPVRGQHNCGFGVTHGNVAVYDPPTRLDVGRRAVANDQLSANVTVHQVVVYGQSMSAAEIALVGEFNEHRLPALLYIGDSLNNVFQPAEQVAMFSKPLGYVPFFSEGQGGRGLNYHLGLLQDIIATEPKFAHYLLILIEGGLDTSSLNYAETLTEGPFTELDYQTYLRDIFDLFELEAKVIVSPNPNAVASDADPALLAAWNVTVDNIKATYPDYFADWVPLAQAQAATNADYLGYRSTQRIPPPLLEAGATDVHISWGDQLGYYWMAKGIWQKLQTLGFAKWIL